MNSFGANVYFYKGFQLGTIFFSDSVAIKIWTFIFFSYLRTQLYDIFVNVGLHIQYAYRYV